MILVIITPTQLAVRRSNLLAMHITEGLVLWTLGSLVHGFHRSFMVKSQYLFDPLRGAARSSVDSPNSPKNNVDQWPNSEKPQGEKLEGCKYPVMRIPLVNCEWPDEYGQKYCRALLAITFFVRWEIAPATENMIVIVMGVLARAHRFARGKEGLAQCQYADGHDSDSEIKYADPFQWVAWDSCLETIHRQCRRLRLGSEIWADGGRGWFIVVKNERKPIDFKVWKSGFL